VLQWIHMYVTSVCFKCFSYSRHMLQLFLFGCCKVDLDVPCITGFTCMLQIYALNISFVFKHMLQVFSSRCCKTSFGGCKSTSAFQIPVCTCKTERAEPHALMERSR
jgi:hypothetical protein